MYFHAMNVKPYYISPMNHGSNRAERYIRTLNDIICKYLTGIGDKWPLFVLPSCWAMNTQKFQRLQNSHHLRWFIILNLQICSILNYKPGKTGINVRTDQYMEIMFKRKAMMDQIIIDNKTYEKNTQ